MSDSQLVPAGRGRVVLPGVQLPSPPPTRIYISGHEYAIQAPRVALLPLINTIKLVLNFVGPAGRVAKNIMYLLRQSGPGSTSDPTFLTACADGVMTNYAAANCQGSMATNWSLQSVTARDHGGTSATGNSTHAAIPGVATGAVHPPQVAIAVSWQIAESYRGGKPRTYIPGIPVSATLTTGDSVIDPTFATLVDTHYTAFLTALSGTAIGSTVVQLGTISNFTAHSLRPTPLFRQFLSVKVHERLDSQRRRSGRESTFAVTP